MALYKVPEGLDYLRMNDFKAASDRYDGLARSARFTVSIKLGNNLLAKMGYQSIVNEFAYICESTELPGRGFMQIDNVRYYGPAIKLPYQTSYEDITLTFLVRNKYVERQFFDDWMETINPTNHFDFRYRDEYAGEIDIFVYGEKPDIDKPKNDTRGLSTAPKAEYSFRLRKAYPILVNPQPVTWADDNFQRLGITFTYEKWIRVNRDNQSSSYNLVKGRETII